MLDWPSSSSSEWPTSIAVHADKDTACAAARDILSFKRLGANGDAGGEMSSLGQSKRELIKAPRGTATAKEAG